MSRPTFAVIDTQAFAANYRHARRLAPAARALAVIKANAYGHGAVALARVLEEEADAFGVASGEEAMELRESGIRAPLVLLEGPFEPDEIARAALHDCRIVIHCHEQLDWLLIARIGQPLTVWLKVDTGMHRLGFAPAEVAEVYGRLCACPNVADVVLMTHFACADETDHPATGQQLDLFRETTVGIEASRTLANSAAVLAWPQAHADWIRPGIMLYGSSPLQTPNAASDALLPVMHFESRLIAVRELGPGESVGYGARFTCERQTRVGVVAAGYADGYPRHAPDGTPVAVNGRRTRLIGRVSMDMLTVDLSDQPHAQIGDPVQLWGDLVSANQVADLCETIAYELFTGITRRVQFQYR